MYKTLLGVNSFNSKKTGKPGLMLHTASQMNEDETRFGASVNTYFVMLDDFPRVFGCEVGKIDFKSLIGASIDMAFTDRGFVDSIRV